MRYQNMKHGLLQCPEQWHQMQFDFESDTLCAPSYVRDARDRDESGESFKRIIHSRPTARKRPKHSCSAIVWPCTVYDCRNSIFQQDLHAYNPKWNNAQSYPLPQHSPEPSIDPTRTQFRRHSSSNSLSILPFTCTLTHSGCNFEMNCSFACVCERWCLWLCGICHLSFECVQYTSDLFWPPISRQTRRAHTQTCRMQAMPKWMGKHW